MIKKSLAAALVVLSISIFVPISAYAVESGGIGGRPANPVASNPRTSSIFIYQLKPGQQKTDAVTVFNGTSKKQTIAVYPVDAVLSSGGAFACAQRADTQTGVGTWIKLNRESVTLGPNSSQKVPFTVTVPKKADVGEHDGCIAIQAQSQTNNSSKTNGVILSFRSAIRVVVTVPGKIVKKLAINSLKINRSSSQGYVIVPTVNNMGNVSLDANVRVGLDNVVLGRAASKNGIFPVLPASTASWNFVVKRPFWGGWYHADANVTYNSNPNAELGMNQGATNSVALTSATIFISPSIGALIIYIAFILVLAAAVYFYIRKTRDIKQISATWESYTVKSSDTLTNLSKDRHASWQKVARANKIKPPYNLQKGQKLKLPPLKKDK